MLGRVQVRVRLSPHPRWSRLCNRSNQAEVEERKRRCEDEDGRQLLGGEKREPEELNKLQQQGFVCVPSLVAWFKEWKLLQLLKANPKGACPMYATCALVPSPKQTINHDETSKDVRDEVGLGVWALWALWSGY